MFAYPAKLPQGTVCDMPAGIHDIMPTLLSLADIPLNAPVDGIDLTPAMLGKYQERTCMVSHTLGSPRQQYMVADKEYKYIYHEVNGVEELYDQRFDRGELHNLAKDMPEKEILQPCPYHHKATSKLNFTKSSQKKSSQNCL